MQSFGAGEEKFTFMMQLCSATVDEALHKADIKSKNDELCLRTV